MFYGPPGTGKTSVVSALAAHFGLSIYLVNLAGFNDRTLMKAVNEIATNSVLLFEDIDCMKSSNARAPSTSTPDHGALDAGSLKGGVQTREGAETVGDKNGVTLSGLLNALDGFYAPTNVLFMMTTNRMEALDEALLRPGRIDYRLYMGKATERQKMELYRRFFPQALEFEARAFVEISGAQTMAEFQGVLLGLEQEQLSCELATQ